jgi:pimeloyl-ACP methyl ester carboxylesterase
MITKRARRWLRRGVAAAIVLAVILVSVAVYYYTEVIEEELLTMTAIPPEGDPSEVMVLYEDVRITGPLGPLPAWYSSGVDDTWVLFVHGHDGSRDDTLHALSAVKRLGFPVLVVSYRNDAGAPSSPNGKFGLGRNEWPDVEAAVEYGFAAGARDVVLAGFGSGALVAAALVHGSDWSPRVRGLIFEAPQLDSALIIDRRARDQSVPGFVPDWARGVATLRFGVDWANTDQLRRAEEFEVPILLIHGSEDQEMPVSSSDAFAELLPDLVTYERFEDAGYLEAWSSDPDRYEAAIRTFLRDVALGPSDLDLVDVEEE